jgi:hypothetical protein
MLMCFLDSGLKALWVGPFDGRKVQLFQQTPRSQKHKNTFVTFPIKPK